MDSFIDFLKLTAQGTVCIVIFVVIVRVVGEIADYLLPNPLDMVIMAALGLAAFYALMVKLTEPDV